MDLGSISGIILKYLINPAIWLLLIGVFLIGTVGILWLRKKRKMIYPVAEIVDLGKGKGGINTDQKAGWFGKKSYFNNLWWSGDEIIRTTRGDIIVDFSTEDFQEVNGERGIICFRDPLRPNLLVPISKFKINGKELVADIAPSDFTDVAINIIKDAAAETSDWRDKLIQFGAWALVVIFSLIAIIVITQMVKTGQKEAGDLLISAGKEGAAACKDICAQAVNIVASKSTAP